MELNKCPNCSGKLQLSSNRTKMVCTYCGGEFTLDDTTKKEVADTPITKDWFVYEWKYDVLKDDPKLGPVISAFVRTLNDYDSSSDVEQYMREYLMNFQEISAPGLREDKMRDIIKRLTDIVNPDERIILYNDDGLFTHGKTGVVVTTKRTFFIEKKNIREAVHAAVPYFLFEVSTGLPVIKLGEKYANNISTFNSHYELMGTVAALICMYSFEQKPDRPKIRLTSTIK